MHKLCLVCTNTTTESFSSCPCWFVLVHSNHQGFTIGNLEGTSSFRRGRLHKNRRNCSIVGPPLWSCSNWNERWKVDPRKERAQAKGNRRCSSYTKKKKMSINRRMVEKGFLSVEEKKMGTRTTEKKPSTIRATHNIPDVDVEELSQSPQGEIEPILPADWLMNNNELNPFPRKRPKRLTVSSFLVAREMRDKRKRISFEIEKTWQFEWGKMNEPSGWEEKKDEYGDVITDATSISSESL